MCSGGIHDSGSRPTVNNSRIAGRPPIALRALLVPAHRGGLRRLARCTLAPTRWNSSATNRQPVVASNADLELLATKPLAEPPHPGPMRGRDPRRASPHRSRCPSLSGDLCSVLVKAHHDRHLQRLLALGLRGRDHARTRGGVPPGPGRPSTCHLSSHAGGPRAARATQPMQVRLSSRQGKRSQPAAAREPTEPAGQHRPPTREPSH